MRRRHCSAAPAAAKALAALAALVALAACAGPREPTDPAGRAAAAHGHTREWPAYNGTRANTKYSPLDQIDRSNVHRLEVAWIYRTGDEGYAIQCNPIVVDGVLYGTTPALHAFALDAATGRELWRFDPATAGAGEDRKPAGGSAVSRGVTYWAAGSDRRIFFGYGPDLYALDAATGRPIPSFGAGGRVDLLRGLDRDTRGQRLRMTTPGIVYRDLLIVGAAVGEGEGPQAPGHVRAYDVRTGERRWIFHTIPHPGEFGYETWPPDAWKTFGGANPWGGFSLDEERGLVFFGTGSPSHDHFGANRHGQNLFGNSVVALNAATGERVWHYQLVHHDLWDYDLPTPPNLVTVEHDGRRIDAVAQVTKTGMLFLFDRETGRPLFPIEERPVARSTVPGERPWPTQPIPTRPRPYARQGFTEADITDRTSEAHAYVRENVFAKYGESRLYDPPSFEGSLILPQFNGGTDWGGASVDPETGILYVNASNEAEILRVIPAPPGSSFPYKEGGHQPVKDQDGFPVNSVPWGTLNAIDLNRGEILWQVPFGVHPGMDEDGPPTGTFNMGGSVVTAGGLVFIGAAMDEKFRAFDKTTGELLWEHRLPAGGYATPAVYEVEGRQFVVIAAGGGGKPGTRAGDAYVAFALPDPDAPSVAHVRAPAAGATPDLPAAEGARLYQTRCASCHQLDGRGTPGEFPPLVGTDWVTGDKGRLIRVVLGGLSGEIRVGDIVYDGAMPPWAGFLDDAQAAALLSYIRNAWGNQASTVSEEEVAAVRAATAARQSLWSADELGRPENSGIPRGRE